MEEKQKVEEKIALLFEEKDLIENHLRQQHEKLNEVWYIKFWGIDELILMIVGGGDGNISAK